jgi:hypothetical protein
MNTSALSQQSARELTLIKWRTLHLQLGVAAATIPLIFIVPSLLGRNNPVHVAGRIITPVVTILAGGLILKSAGEIETLAPLVNLIESQNLALLKHGLNSQTYVETKSNTLYAAKTVMQLTESLEPEVSTELPLEVSAEEVPTSKDFPVSEVSVSEISVSDVSTEITQQQLGLVSRAILEELSDTVIIEKVLGYGGRHFAKGKEILTAIKKQLGLE